MADPVQIDPATGERIQSSAPQIDPATGERMAASPPAAPPPQEGFWESLGHTFGIGKEEATAQLKQAQEHPLVTALKAAIPGAEAVQGAYQGGKRIIGELGQAASELKQGEPGQAAIHAVNAVPFLGPAIQHGAEQLGPGESINRAELGTALGTAVQTAPMVLGAADSLVPGRPVIPNPPVSRMALLGRTPEAAYESALKPSTTLSHAERTAAIQTGLENSIPVSKGGVERIGGLIDQLNQKIAAEIGNDPNRPIDPNAVATRADVAKAKFAKQVNAQPDLNAIEASRQQFLDEQGAQPGKPGVAPQPTGLLDAQGRPIMSQGTPATPPQTAPPMGAADAQAMKQGTYRVLKGKFGEQGSASVEAQKALARGLKEEIATQFPEISKLNATESQLLDLQPLLERAVNRISNRDAVGIGGPIAGTAAAAVTRSSVLGGVVTVLKSVLDNPAIKSRLAIAVSKGAKIPYSEALSKVVAYSGSLGSISHGSQESSSGDNPNQPASAQP